MLLYSDFIRHDPLHTDKNMYLHSYERFGTENILVLFYDDLRQQPESLLQRACGFLGINDSFAFDTNTRHGQSAESLKFLFGLGKFRKFKLYANLGLILPESFKVWFRAALLTTQEVPRPVWTGADRVFFRKQY